MSWRIPQPDHGTYGVWLEPYKYLRVPKIFNLRTDPFETADYASNTFWDFMNRHTWMAPAAMSFIGDFIGTLKEYPRRQEATNYSPHHAFEALQNMGAGGA